MNHIGVPLSHLRGRVEDGSSSRRELLSKVKTNVKTSPKKVQRQEKENLNALNTS